MYELLSNTALFRNMSSEEIHSIFKKIKWYTKKYEKNEIILHIGENTTVFGIVLSGIVCVEQNNAWGERSILNTIDSGGIFAEVYALCPNEPLMVQVSAVKRTEILFIDSRSMLCSFDAKLLTTSLLKILARKNLHLSTKINHICAGTIRDKIASYLSYESMKCNRKSFAIPFNRQELADYLNVDRSALSAELSKLKAEGIIDYHKNEFTLKHVDEYI